MKLPIDSSTTFPVEIDFSQLDPSVFSSMRTLFIYLRNLGHPTEDINLGFSYLSFQKKHEALQEFAFGDIELQCKELEETWCQLIEQDLKGKSDLHGILSNDEMSQMHDENQHEIMLVERFCKSSIWWAADVAVKQRKIESSAQQLFYGSNPSTICAANLWRLFAKHADQLDFLAFDTPQIQVYDFPEVFTDNTALSPHLQWIFKTPSAPLVFGARTAQWKTYEKLQSMLKAADAT